MSTSKAVGNATEFEFWIVSEFAARGPFTTLIILVEISEATVTPLSATYLSVIGDDVAWLEILALFSVAGVAWDGAAFIPLNALEGGPLDNGVARMRLRELKRRVANDPLTLNEGHIFDRKGRRLKIEEVPSP